ncbi:hypothetical protein DW1_1309 [Proteiniborus sp. DW1]|uniref:hypothetical protein n=1 Tax=Proteiniborus sp. DW1 TaxID=1889883 RepID=UPI00092E0A6D|nr:hypothetical protein [Proteiniborus sp. DW1]SCG82881.1 hypothetical protein DW1_1309 [Proteiniborus sp. DW1]
MKKTIVFIVFIFSLLLLLSCEKQDYKRIVVEENVELEGEAPVEPSSFGQVYLDLDSSNCFYPAFYYGDEIYGNLKKNHDKDISGKKYLYKLDVYNKISETLKESIDFRPGINKVGLIEDKAYMIDYTIRSKPTLINELSIIINELRENENQYEISYVSGSNRYLVINEMSSSGEVINVFLYDLVDNRFYKNNTHRHGDICYIFELRSLIWIDQKDFKIYKIRFENDHYTLEEYIDLGIDEDISRVRGTMKNGHELILFHDIRLGNKENWNLMGTSVVTSYNFEKKEYTYLFNNSIDKSLNMANLKNKSSAKESSISLSAPIDEYSYIEYIGNGFFIEESFDLFRDYIELTKRSIYYYKYTIPVLVYDEEFKEKSQQIYPEINVLVNEAGNEIFSTREIKKIIDGIPVTKDVIYQRIIISRSR